MQKATGTATPRSSLFNTVRDMPYATNAAHDALQLLEIGRGNCLAKSELLATALASLGCEVRFVRWKYTLPRLPGVVTLPVPFDLHRAVEVKLEASWVLVDATHDSRLASHLRVTDWDGTQSTEPAYDPIGELMRVGVDDEAISAAAAQIHAALGHLDSEQIDSYRAEFNAALEQIRNTR